MTTETVEKNEEIKGTDAYDISVAKYKALEKIIMDNAYFNIRRAAEKGKFWCVIDMTDYRMPYTKIVSKMLTDAQYHTKIIGDETHTNGSVKIFLSWYHLDSSSNPVR